ncbi:citrate lyase beta subunit [Hoeflea sp. IMCC20628]|uniref:HpcH/HpaI aldolase/citrate lyase family protein n=1 Tax=Hoeflea sp. IMCC20628 TaxID=1620421 RepID=UPI00063AA7F4|nr:CoA ester lyase [Hoeflea sp. IMCC20628]AKH98869.1 citrate lyase beta subunit [Hoeflea sp. IMCC20628]
MQSSIRPRRSVLYVPAANAKAMAKSGTLDCDAIVYDLEDAVAPGAKADAREALKAYFDANPSSTKQRVIRVNGAGTEWGAEDFKAAAACRPDAILLPKVEHPLGILSAAAELDRLGLEGVQLWAMIETPLGIVNIGDIARLGAQPDSRLVCFVVGSNDLAKETGVPLPKGRSTLLHWLLQVVIHARAYGLDVVDGVYNDFRDQAGFEAECEEGVVLGFDGKTLIHPSQIAFANQAFAPSPSELAEAQRIVSAFAQPENTDKGVIALEGKMVERLHLDIARKTLAKAGSTQA